MRDIITSLALALCVSLSACTKQGNISYHKRSMNATYQEMQKALAGKSDSHGNLRKYRYHRKKLVQLGFFAVRIYRIGRNGEGAVDSQAVWLAVKEQFGSYPHIVRKTRQTAGGPETSFVVWDTPQHIQRWDRFFKETCNRLGYAVEVESMDIGGIH